MEMVLIALTAAASVLAAQPTSGFSAPTAAVTETANGVTVHGAVCRLTAQAARAPWGVRVREIGASGEEMSAVTVPLVGDSLSGRTLGCAYYNAHLPHGAGDHFLIEQIASQ